jgi:alpha-L-fucosidase
MKHFRNILFLLSISGWLGAQEVITLNPDRAIDNLEMLPAGAADRSAEITVYPVPTPKYLWIQNFGDNSYLQWNLSSPSANVYSGWLHIKASATSAYKIEVTQGGAITSTTFTKPGNGWEKVIVENIKIPAGSSTLKLTRVSGIGTNDIKGLDIIPVSDLPAYTQRVASFRSQKGIEIFQRGYGLFFQYGTWGYPEHGDKKDMETATNDFDVEAFVKMVKATGAKHIIWSLTWYRYRMQMPNATVDKIMGHSDYTTERNLVGEIAAACKAANIDFFLYYHQGIQEDAPWKEKNQWPDGFSQTGVGDRSVFFNNWVNVITEIGTKLGSNLDGWLFDDGCAYYPAPFECLGAAAKVGNPNRFIGYNDWIGTSVTDFQEVTFGEGLWRDPDTNAPTVNGIFTAGRDKGLLAAAQPQLENINWGITNKEQTITLRNGITLNTVTKKIRSALIRKIPVSLSIGMWEEGKISPQTNELLIGLRNAIYEDLPMTEGKYKPTDESLKQYKYPEWFRDAKFGIWAHWGPQAVPRMGDWYGHFMYEGPSYNCKTGKYKAAHPDYTYHLEHYGHPSEFGFKDIIPLWKAERWNPEELMKLYKRVGAKYFVALATHHDNFFLWNSKLHKWNSVNMGPKKDVVGLWQKAAKQEGLHFGISEHLEHSYCWYQKSRGSDQLGPKAGIPYDGANPEYEDLYHGAAQACDCDLEADYYYGFWTKDPKWHKEWYDRIKELLDNYQPELWYSDCVLPFGDVGRTLIAHYYNSDLLTKDKKGVVFTNKESSEGRWVYDHEQTTVNEISEFPWQTDTSIGDWFYRTGQKYMTASQVIQMLVDIVSKNGNLLLNVVQTPEGDLEDDVLQILEGIATWITDNGEAIYGTRPWKVFGEGPSLTGKQSRIVRDRKYQAGDLRFTAKGKTLYAFSLVKPESDIHISSLGLQTATGQKVKSIRMLGSKEKIKWTQNNEEVVIQKPDQLPGYDTIVFEIR